ncbi:MAG: alcohol dehydrogenase catalytic domain-containing protein [Caldilineaceae bacterium]
MSDKLTDFKQADSSLPTANRLWPLYGAGFESLGRDGHMIDVIMPEPGPDELLVRHDAVGICFSDIKVIKAGQNHPRIRKTMSEDPVVLGHEVALTVVKAGANLQKEYHPGDRFIIQADIFYKGIGTAYGYELRGGFQQYNIIDERVLKGDGGNYLLPVKQSTGYAEAALNEPWACVEASYTVSYRTAWKEGGKLYIGGNGAEVRLGNAATWKPGSIVIDVADAGAAAYLSDWAKRHSVAIVQDDGRKYDDIVILGNDAGLIERMFARLAYGGHFAVISQEPVTRSVQLDIGRLHYDRLGLSGAASNEISAAYEPFRTQLQPQGVMWALGAAGPMGQMHVQRAIEMPGGPRKIVATNLNRPRMAVLEEKLTPAAQKHGVELVCLSRDQFESDAALLERLKQETDGKGFDDVVVIAASATAAEEGEVVMAEGCTVNVFAGLPRGTMAGFDLNLVVAKGVRYTGISGSSIDDLRHMLNLTESKQLETNRSVVAIAGLEGVPDGLQAVAKGTFPGKVVIYPMISMPLTTIEALKEKLPSVYAKLESDGSWTNAAEEELLRVML